MGKNKLKFYIANTEETGVIKKIISQKGYGFISVQEHNDAIFYFTDASKLIFKEGDKVKFISKKTGENTVAINIKSLKSANPIQGNKHKQKGSNGKIYLPKDTLTIIEQINKNSNFALQFNKFVRFVKEEKSNKKEEKAELNTPNIDIIKSSYLKQINNNRQSVISKLSLSSIRKFSKQTSWRMAVGLGTESVYETSITLHHIYGIPYIPGQALKGIVRSWFIQKNIPEGFDLNQDKANDKLEEYLTKTNESFRDLFGNSKFGSIKEQSGKVIFFDAFPSEVPMIKKDIMTPHYSEYYGDSSNTKPPADYYDPTPIPFLTVENTAFEFIIGIKASVSETEAKILIDKAEKLLRGALEFNGVGAKTAVGYGYFE